MADDDPKTIEEEFDEAVNMTPKELEDWLETDESKSVGQKDGNGESVGHDSGRRIVAIQRKSGEDYTEPKKEEIETSNWRYSLMNWGHDPCR